MRTSLAPQLTSFKIIGLQIHIVENMQKILLLSIVFISIQCTNKNGIISSFKVKSIVVTLDSTDSHLSLPSIEIRNQDSLNQIIKKINECESEPIIFYPTHRLKITYEDGKEEIIFCSGNALKYDGLTYKLKENIKVIVGN